MKCVVLILPSARIQHDGPWPGHMSNDSPLRAIHRHGADALVDVVTVVDSSVYPVISNAIRSAKIWSKIKGAKQYQLCSYIQRNTQNRRRRGTNKSVRCNTDVKPTRSHLYRC